MQTTSSAIPVIRDTQRTSAEFVKVLYLCILFFIASVTYLFNSLINFHITRLGPIRAFDIHEICIFGDLLLFKKILNAILLLLIIEAVVVFV